MCGLSYFCSAFYNYFDRVIARKWMQYSDGFSKVTCEERSLKREYSFEMDYLFELVMEIKGGINSAYRLKNMM